MNEENAWKFKEGEKLRACSSAGGKRDVGGIREKSNAKSIVIRFNWNGVESGKGEGAAS